MSKELRSVDFCFLIAFVFPEVMGEGRVLENDAKETRPNEIVDKKYLNNAGDYNVYRGRNNY